MKQILTILFLLILLVYEKEYRPKVCHNKIHIYINHLGGTVISINKITPRDEIYSIYYTLDKQEKHINIKFNFFYKITNV